MTIVPNPGFVSPRWLNVQECLRQRHDETRASIAEAIKQREAKQIPLDDRADWKAELARLCADATAKAKRDEAADVLQKALAVANGALRPLPPYEPDPALDGVEVKLRALSKADVLEMRAALSAARYEGDDDALRLQGAADQHRASFPFLLKSIAAVRGVTTEEGAFSTDAFDVAALDVLDVCGLLPALFQVAEAYQGLSPLGRRGFGSSPPRTSPSSSAESAHPSDAPSLDAKAEAGGSLARTSPPTSVPRDTSATTAAETSAAPSKSTAHAEVSPG